MGYTAVACDIKESERVEGCWREDAVTVLVESVVRRVSGTGVSIKGPGRNIVPAWLMKSRGLASIQRIYLCYILLLLQR